MSKKKPEPIAEVLDKFMHAVAIALLLFSLKFATSAAMHFADGSLLNILDWTEIVLTGLAVIILIPAGFRFKLLKYKPEHRFFEPNGYVIDIFRRSFEKGFSITFLMLVILDVATKRHFTEIPTAFFIEIILVVMLGSFGIAFFLLSHRADTDLFDDGEGVEK